MNEKKVSSYREKIEHLPYKIVTLEYALRIFYFLKGDYKNITQFFLTRLEHLCHFFINFGPRRNVSEI